MAVESGALVAGRFVIDRLAGEGGMGAVYRARDTVTGESVALKLLQGGTHDAARFDEEARVLCELHHPGIVRYVAHGVTVDGQRYLAMEWLEGEDLAKRLERAPMTVRESVELVRNVAEALGYAHAQGVVHRDVKPSNLYLLGGRIADVKVLDFGVARRGLTKRAITRTGAMVGTPGYISVEQARGEREIDARADVFALGCVLYECIAGAPVFKGDTALALLAKILLEDPPRLGESADVPRALDELTTRMLSKDREARPRDGGAVATALAELLGHGNLRGSLQPPAAAPMSLTSAEQRLVGIVVAQLGTTFDVVNAPTVLSLAGHATLVDKIGALGGRVDQLAGGSVIVSLQNTGAATDLAVRAAQCALAMRVVLADAPMVIATGRANVSGRAPVGAVIDRAAKLLGVARGSRPTTGSLPVRIDEVTAGLLDARFDVSGDAGGLHLIGERETSDPTRTFMGRPTSCVGRDRDLRNLEGIFEECVSEPVARAVLLTGPAGMGKSRLRHELVQLLSTRRAPPRLWMARGDPISAGSSLGLIVQALRRELGVRPREDVTVERQKILSRVSRHIAPDRAKHVAELLGELVGVPFPESGSLPLLAARRDPVVMGHSMRRAWEDFVFAEVAQGPLLIILEDIHWSDAATLAYVDGALRLFHDKPLMVLATSRPEVTTLFPDLWKARGVDTIELKPLTRNACEKLSREVLGKRATDTIIGRIVARAAGNAFYLEELIRAEAEGPPAGDNVPGTVKAMIHARLDALDPSSRRALRAASVFGEVFWERAVVALMGGESEASHVRELFDALVEREQITRVGQSRFPDEREYVFRHGLVRDVVYETLTEQDLTLGHALAGQWLQAAGETDASVLAGHLERGGELATAVGLWDRATRDALAVNEFVLAAERAQRGLACGATGEARGVLLALQAEALRWESGPAEALKRCEEAMPLLAFGSAEFFDAIATALQCALSHGAHEQNSAIEQQFLRAPIGPGADSAFARAAHGLSDLMFLRGDRAGSEALTERVFELARHSSDPLLAGSVENARAHDVNRRGDIPAYRDHLRAARAHYVNVHDERAACVMRVNEGHAGMMLGDNEEAERALRDGARIADRLHIVRAETVALQNLGVVLGRRGRFEEGAKVEQDAIERAVTAKDRRVEAFSRLYLVEIMMNEGVVSGDDLSRLLNVSQHFAYVHAYALAVASRVALKAGDVARALSAVREAGALRLTVGRMFEGHFAIDVALARALDASGDREAARGVIAGASRELNAHTERFSDKTWRKSFLENIPTHAEAMELARAWNVDALG